MNRARRTTGLSIALITILLVSGCATGVRTQLSTFRSMDADFGSGSVAVQPADEARKSSLEFDFYRDKVESRLQEVGYSIAPPEEALYIARLGYSVQEARPDVRPPNLFFTTGFGSYHRRGGIGVLMREYPDHRPEYLRRVTLTITRTPEELGGEPSRVYEATASSRGGCPVLSVVFDEMLAAIFQRFPGDNGAVQTVTVRGDGRCE